MGAGGDPAWLSLRRGERTETAGGIGVTAGPLHVLPLPVSALPGFLSSSSLILLASAWRSLLPGSPLTPRPGPTDVAGHSRRDGM